MLIKYFRSTNCDPFAAVREMRLVVYLDVVCVKYHTSGYSSGDIRVAPRYMDPATVHLAYRSHLVGRYSAMPQVLDTVRRRVSRLKAGWFKSQFLSALSFYGTLAEGMILEAGRKTSTRFGTG